MTRTRARVVWRRVAAAAGLIVLVAVATVAGGASGGGGGSTTTVARPTAAFLRLYVQPDGRIRRPGNGGDTVSEGQAYGLLLAQIANRPATFHRIWHWTATHLQQPDGLLAWHADSAGRVLSTMPASDADLLTAWALSRASGRGSSEYHAQARRIANAMLSTETVRSGPFLLAAGPWATGSPGTLDPSYWSPLAFAALAKFTKDPRWTELWRGAYVYIRALTGDGLLLPPDWARIDGDAATAEPAPGGGAPQVQFGLDAQRVVVWMATSCDAADRRLVARWWRRIAPGGRPGAIALGTMGNVIDGSRNSLGYVAAAAAAQADGDTAAMNRLLEKALEMQHQEPDYYGAAWLALGDALVKHGALGSCAGKGIRG